MKVPLFFFALFIKRNIINVRLFSFRFQVQDAAFRSKVSTSKNFIVFFLLLTNVHLFLRPFSMYISCVLLMYSMFLFLGYSWFGLIRRRVFIFFRKKIMWWRGKFNPFICSFFLLSKALFNVPFFILAFFRL